MKRILAGLALAVALILIAPAVTAAEAPGAGPMWWKITDGGGSTLWVLGVPDGMVMDFRWNDASLRQRMSKARLLISPVLGKPLTAPAPFWTPIGDQQQPCPPIPPGFPTPPAPDWAYDLDTTPGGAANQNIPINWVWWRTLGRNQYDLTLCVPWPPAMPPPLPINSVTLKDPLSFRLTPEMMQRVEKDLPFALGEGKTAMLNGKTWELALWMDLWNWPHGKLLGNPVTDKAQDIAQNSHIPIASVHVPALWKPILVDNELTPAGKEQWGDFDWLYDIRPNIRIDPPEALQDKCLDQVLTQTESGQMPALRQAAMEAWARGDLANGLKRSNTAQLCLMGDLPATNAGAFEAKQAQLYETELDKAFEQKGETVGLVEFDPLLLEKGGVLEHYKKLGYAITTSDGME